jgi:dolichol-phosphate mannosyltransferase
MNLLTSNKIHLSSISLGIIIPMANESETVEDFVKAVCEEVKRHDFKSFNLFAILDNVSTDGTLNILEEISNDYPELKVVFAPENRCVVDAYKRGYQEAIDANCDWILEMDAGFSHNPSDMHKFIRAMQKGYDCVFGSRFMKGGGFKKTPFKRYLLSKFGTILTNILLGTKLSDMTSGYEMFSTNSLESILEEGIYSTGPFFQTEIKAHAHKFRIKEVPILHSSPSHNIRKDVLGDAFKNLWRLYGIRHQFSFVERIYE